MPSVGRTAYRWWSDEEIVILTIAKEEKTSINIAVFEFLHFVQDDTILTKNSNKMKKMKKYRCKVCKWVYDPEFGDIKGGIPANTAFEDLPVDWVCPVCKAEKKKFEEIG